MRRLRSGAGEWPREQFRKHGVTYEVSDRSKSEIYLDVLPLLNSRRVTLLDHPRLVSQLCDLERLTSRGGKDMIDHPPGTHDDVANACAGAVLAAYGAHKQPLTTAWRAPDYAPLRGPAPGGYRVDPVTLKPLGTERTCIKVHNNPRAPGAGGSWESSQQIRLMNGKEKCHGCP